MTRGEVLTPASGATRTSAPRGWDRAEVSLAVGAFAVLCIMVLTAAPFLVEPDDYAYRASIVAITQGHFLTLTTAQVHALGAQLTGGHWSQPGLPLPPIAQWVRLSGGRWISEKDPGYPFLAAPFQALGAIALLGAWLVVRVPSRAALAGLPSRRPCSGQACGRSPTCGTTRSLARARWAGRRAGWRAQVCRTP